MGATLSVGSPLELDIPRCATGVPGCDYDEAGGWTHTVTGTTWGYKEQMTTLNFHCHAPACISMTAYVCEEGVSLDNCNTTNGKVLCAQYPVLGGSGDVSINGTRFDEAGYIEIPACLWGDAAQGLPAPVNITNRAVHMVKVSNASVGHYGEMVRMYIFFVIYNSFSCTYCL